ncbi:MAG: hypothetical protein U1E71_00420 [Ramlibacter sp.]
MRRIKSVRFDESGENCCRNCVLYLLEASGLFVLGSAGSTFAQDQLTGDEIRSAMVGKKLFARAGTGGLLDGDAGGRHGTDCDWQHDRYRHVENDGQRLLRHLAEDPGGPGTLLHGGTAGFVAGDFQP